MKQKGLHRCSGEAISRVIFMGQKQNQQRMLDGVQYELQWLMEPAGICNK